MSTPLSATGRIVLPYVVQSRTHTVRTYVRNVQVSGGSFNINSRATDANDTVWTSAANALAESFSYGLPTGATFGVAVLQTLSGLVWLPVATFTITATTHFAGSYHPGGQGTLVLRDLNFKKVKVLQMEGNLSIPWHAITLDTMETNQQNMAKQWTSTFTVTTAPYNWQVGRGNTFLSTAPLVGWTADLNDKIRRARGLT